MYYISARNSIGHFLVEREDMNVIFIVLMEFSIDSNEEIIYYILFIRFMLYFLY